ncbi:BtrH N-terminal domain-containing protein [Desulfopila inferna]|uniref:BtrH N-terminal domain-containing protein n=1 Tax=Desulfopila inferna TaxID=468528 RepID=UPI001F070BE7|nr:BtrH N-terminal domain-containing protein [Desulfopila inferna]
MDIEIDFPHRQTAHCESGVTSNLLRFHGIECSESLAFGIGEGLFFGYLPFIRLNKLPLTTYRCAVGRIFKKVNSRLGVSVSHSKFRSPEKAMKALDRKLDEGIPVGCQTGAYWLPYFPPAFRFHFNMHNLVVIGRRGDEYLISDPVFEEVVRCSRGDLLRARFAKGALAPHGAMYYLDKIPGNPDLHTAARQGIISVCRTMLKIPVFFLGTRGIDFLAGRLADWPRKMGQDRAILSLGQLIRMQEEIGTGGGGFRFMYAAFLQEAAALLEKPQLHDCSERLTLIGDNWRKFAVTGARICKGRSRENDTFAHLAEILRECAASERLIYADLLELLSQPARLDSNPAFAEAQKAFRT